MTRRILVIGAGFAGVWSALSAARELDMRNRADVEVLVVAPTPTMTIRPRLYEANPDLMVADLEGLFLSAGIRFMPGFAISIAPETQTVTIRKCDDEERYIDITYDRLVLAAGSHIQRLGIPGFTEHTFSVDDLAEAMALDAHLKSLSKRAPSAQRDTVVVLGGGFTGLELATELPARLREIFGPDAKPRVVIVERAREIGPELGAGPRPVILEALQQLDVECRLGAAAVAIEAGGIVLVDGERIEGNPAPKAA